MAYIKKMVMQGFKSFAKRTEVIFDRGINVVLGPNGSGKSNISDALCFVLGRLSIKSMRAAKSKNLLFMGSKYVKPAREATVELVFDNTDRVFGIDADEIILHRTVKHNGQGVYKINGETKTRIEIIELLAQAGIDPHGFNLVLQGQIQAIVKMHPEDRRKIIEEVAGISIYEARKEKSLKELQKTDERLKEINAILREKTTYLKNLEKERSQALRAQELETTVKRAKASLLHKKLNEKLKELGDIEKSIEEKTQAKDKIKAQNTEMYNDVESLSNKIHDINKQLQRATGVEQETLHNQIANLKAEIEGLRVKKEGLEHRKIEIVRRTEEMQKSIPELEAEIKKLVDKSPLVAQKAQELKKKKEEFAQIEAERKKLLTIRTETNALRERIKDRERQISRATADSEALVKQIEEATIQCEYKTEKTCSEAILKNRTLLAEKRNLIKDQQQVTIQAERKKSVAETEISTWEKNKEDVTRIDICPLCQSKITAEHIGHVHREADGKIGLARQSIISADESIDKAKILSDNAYQEITKIEQSLSAAEIELVRHRTIVEKHEQLKRRVQEEQTLKKELLELQKRLESLERTSIDARAIEEQYDAKLLEIEEISSRTEEDVDTAAAYKQREVENQKNIIKRNLVDKQDIEDQIAAISESYTEKKAVLEVKEKQEQELTQRYKKLFEDRDNMQREMQEKNLEISELQSSIRQVEEQINYLKIGSAKLDAEKQTVEAELVEYPGVEIIQGSVNYLQERLAKAQEGLREIGSINMRALEVYEEIKKEYDIVFEKVTTLEAEKTQIMAIIEEIDKKKIRSFMKTFRGINELFTTNFSKVYTKGSAFLEIENKEDVFAGGVNIVVKLAKGKYFDVTSLSGGEQTLVALSLLFAIQEFRPYHFYVFDEIDAALDKRNSERLAALLNQYMKSGQYIVITHNDAIIMNANVLYGVSMHDGVSKILSLQLPKPTPIANPMASETTNAVAEEVVSEEEQGIKEPEKEELFEDAEAEALGDELDEQEQDVN
ncbi:MAG TPA: chromosome segregation SMC family protein [Candidatus Nanoarchaeia archaeon]|nr:chromosome segregation SMC family protein [Candidatus Nanoarchaeia archaeon]